MITASAKEGRKVSKTSAHISWKCPVVSSAVCCMPQLCSSTNNKDCGSFKASTAHFFSIHMTRVSVHITLECTTTETTEANAVVSHSGMQHIVSYGHLYIFVV